MKTMITKNLLAALVILAIPGAAFAGNFLDAQPTYHFEYNEPESFADGRPTIELIGASRIGSGMADVAVSYELATAEYSNDKKPFVYIEYTNTKTDEASVTNHFYESMGDRTTMFTLSGLSRGTKYSYRAVMKYDGRTYRTDSKTFTTAGATVSSTTTSNTSTNTTTSSNTSSTIKLPTLGSVANVAAPVAKKVENAIYTAGSNHSNGVAIGITDEQARVSVGDTIDFTVQYQNTRTTSLQNAELAIELPEEYEFIRSKSDFDYDERTNVITLPIGRIAPDGKIHSVTFTARAIGDGDREVRTTATLFHESGKISASDRDAFHGGSKSVLGASVFGAGFFPQTFVGWLLIIFLITILIIAARRYVKPIPQPQVVQKTA